MPHIFFENYFFFVLIFFFNLEKEQQEKNAIRVELLWFNIFHFKMKTKGSLRILQFQIFVH
jgi:hypothetical protein